MLGGFRSFISLARSFGQGQATFYFLMFYHSPDEFSGISGRDFVLACLDEFIELRFIPSKYTIAFYDAPDAFTVEPAVDPVDHLSLPNLPVCLWRF